MDHLQRSSVGAPWDDAFGGGIVDGAVTLITGAPGVGKTGMLLQIAAGLATDRRRNVLYVLRGQTPISLREKMDRCGIPQGRISIATGLDGGLIARIGTFAAVIVDPVEENLDEVKNVCKSTGTPLFIVKNLAEGASLHSGDIHTVDVFAEILFADVEDPGGRRLLRIMKNRYGRVLDTPLAMTDGVLKAAPPKRWHMQLAGWLKWAFHGRWR